jgi:hypothetical protein
MSISDALKTIETKLDKEVKETEVLIAQKMNETEGLEIAKQIESLRRRSWEVAGLNYE